MNRPAGGSDAWRRAFPAIASTCRRAADDVQTLIQGARDEQLRSRQGVLRNLRQRLGRGPLLRAGQPKHLLQFGARIHPFHLCVVEGNAGLTGFGALDLQLQGTDVPGIAVALREVRGELCRLGDGSTHGYTLIRGHAGEPGLLRVGEHAQGGRGDLLLHVPRIPQR